MRRGGLGVLLTGLLAVAGCTATTEAGAPISAASSVAVSATTTSVSPSTSPSATTGGPSSPSVSQPSFQPATTPTLPPRPRSFDLSTVNPCELISAEKRMSFGIDRPPFGPTREKDVYYCTFASSTGPGLGIFIDTGGNAVQRLTQNSQLGPPLDRFTVNGFLITTIASGDPRGCIAMVDTGDDESLQIQIIAKSFDAPREPTCQRLRQWVPPIMDALAAMQP